MTHSEKSNFFFFLLFLLGTCINLSNSWEIISSSSLSKGRFCAKLYSNELYQGNSFSLSDHEQIVDMASVQGWNDTSRISARVKPSCTLFLGMEPYFKGMVHEFREDFEVFGEQGEHHFSTGSVLCQCKKICNCNEVRFHGRECVRGYFEKDCTNCDAHYAPFKQEKEISGGEATRDKIQSLLVRPGCSLRIKYSPYGETTQLTEEFESSGERSQIFPFNGTIKSTSCLCEGIIIQKPKVNKSDPVLLNISPMRGVINSELKKPGRQNHPGLLAALQSLRARRSPKSAYILLLGLTGSGKSTTVNLLFDNPNITKVGSANSTTTDIQEFRIPVQVNELGLNNSELRIIDTPGIADTRGIAQDSRFLATFDHFLSTHEDLKKSLPNVILIFVKFHNNRFYGEGTSFVKMLKTIELFRDKVIDPNYSNIIFVLTHYMSETKGVQRDPSEKIRKFKKVIEEFSSLPKPIVLVVAENKPEEFDLPGLNGYWQLPNGEFYPRNLFEQIQRTLTACGDPVGLSVIQTAFSHSNPSDFDIKGKTYSLLPSTHTKVIKYFGILSSLEMPGAASELGNILDRTYSTLEPQLKTQYPSVLTHLKRVFSIKNVKEVKELPKTTVEIIKFFKAVQINPASIYLLDKGLNLTIPHFSKQYFVGSGFDLLGDNPLSTPIFDLDTAFHPSGDIGFQLPENIDTTVVSQVQNVLSILTSREDYISTRLGNLGLSAEKGSNIFTNSPGTKPGLNIILNSDFNQTGLQLSALIEYQKFQIGVKNNPTLSPGFLQGLRNLEGFNSSNFESVQGWNNFLRIYGTHVVVSAFVGGSIEVEVQIAGEEDLAHYTEISIQTDEGDDLEDSNEDSLNDIQQQQPDPDPPIQSTIDKFSVLTQTMSNLLQYLADNFLGKETPVSIPQNVDYSIKMRGGNPNYYISNLTHHSGEVEIWNILDKWQKSLAYEPEILTSYFKLVPISMILKNIQNSGVDIGADKAEQFAEAASAYLNSSLVYIPVVRVEGGIDDREHSGGGGRVIGDFESMQEFAKIFSQIAAESKRMQDNFMALMLETQRVIHFMALMLETQRVTQSAK